MKAMNEMTPPSAGGVSPETQREVEQFLYYEADLLDRFALEEWFGLLTEDFSIRAPIRSYTHPGTEHPEFSEDGYYIKNGHTMVRERVTRLKKEYAWAENPRSRVRHVLGNVYVTETDEGYDVINNQHVYRSKGDTADNDTISAQRETTLRDTDDGFRIADRTVYLDDSIVSTDNITLPLL
jgi:3-phenylpropionate/cinnamic acid dioxygenase small subunit